MGAAKADVMTAALNNAELCDIVCRTHRIVGAFEAHLWASPRRTPDYYPDAVTLDPAVVGERLLEIVDTATPGCSVKDSFASLDLSSAGFRILFEAQWIIGAPERPVRAGRVAIDWQRIRAARELQAWEAAWSGWRLIDRLFLPSLLGHTSVPVLGGYVDDRLVAGFVLNQSRDAVGVSNLFTTVGEIADAWPACLAAVARISPGLPIVGYESGDALAAAHEHGFTAIGPLRVWIKEPGRPETDPAGKDRDDHAVRKGPPPITTSAGDPDVP